MRLRKYTFYFKSGKVTVSALNEEQGKILAQAKAIENAWDHTIMEKPNIEKLDMHINWNLLSGEDQTTLHSLLCKAKVRVDEPYTEDDAIDDRIFARFGII